MENAADGSDRSTIFCREDAVLILALVIFSLALHGWLIGHTEVAARDSIGFIRYAWQLEHQPWGEVFRRNHQHPGYPILLSMVSRGIRHLVDASNVTIFQLSAQWTSAVAGMLIVIPIYFLGNIGFGRGVGFWSAALLLWIPLTSRLMADGLSEATFLLFAAAALLFGFLALERLSKIWFALCGLFTGLAYLIRPEGGMILTAAVLVLLACQGLPAWRRPWKMWFVDTAIMIAAAALTVSPYCIAIGGLTTKPAPQAMFRASLGDDPGEQSLRLEPAERRVEIAAVFATYAPSAPYNKYWWAVQALASEVSRGFHFIAGLAALLGLWLVGRRLRYPPVAFLLTFVLLQALILWRLANVVGYLSERHVVTIVLLGVIPCSIAIPALARWLTWLVDRVRFTRRSQIATRSQEHWLTVAFFAALAIYCLPETVKPLHLNRSGHRQAGLWLAEHADPQDPIIDSCSWAHYYAGKVFIEDDPPPARPGYVPTCYVVMDLGVHPRLTTIPEARRIAHQGKMVYYWPEKRSADDAKVFVYAVSMKSLWGDTVTW
jgi:hypothetical protein